MLCASTASAMTLLGRSAFEVNAVIAVATGLPSRNA